MSSTALFTELMLLGVFRRLPATFKFKTVVRSPVANPSQK